MAYIYCDANIKRKWQTAKDEGENGSFAMQKGLFCCMKDAQKAQNVWRKAKNIVSLHPKLIAYF